MYPTASGVSIVVMQAADPAPDKEDAFYEAGSYPKSIRYRITVSLPDGTSIDFKEESGNLPIIRDINTAARLVMEGLGTEYTTTDDLMPEMHIVPIR